MSSYWVSIQRVSNLLAANSQINALANIKFTSPDPKICFTTSQPISVNGNVKCFGGPDNCVCIIALNVNHDILFLVKYKVMSENTCSDMWSCTNGNVDMSAGVQKTTRADTDLQISLMKAIIHL
jgi:hypothetical protein